MPLALYRFSTCLDIGSYHTERSPISNSYFESAGKSDTVTPGPGDEMRQQSRFFEQVMYVLAGTDFYCMFTTQHAPHFEKFISKALKNPTR